MGRKKDEQQLEDPHMDMDMGAEDSGNSSGESGSEGLGSQDVGSECAGSAGSPTPAAKSSASGKAGSPLKSPGRFALSVQRSRKQASPKKAPSKKPAEPSSGTGADVERGAKNKREDIFLLSKSRFQAVVSLGAAIAKR